MLDTLISAGSRLLGGLLDKGTADSNRDAQMAQSAQNIALQREFAQNGIRWKVADAKAAGIHPAFALGANTTSFSPVSIGSLPDSNWSSTLGGMGQDISRSINATRTAGERNDAFSLSMQKAQLEGANLDNDIKRASLASSIQRLKQTSNPPIPGIVPEDDFSKRAAMQMGKDFKLETDPYVTNAEDAETRYGDIGENLWGVYALWRDYVANNGNPIPDWLSVRPGSLLDNMKKQRMNFNARFGEWRK